MGFFPELAERSLEELIRDFSSDPTLIPGVEEEERALWLDEVAIALAEMGQAGLDYLIQQAARGTCAIRRFLQSR